MEKIISEIMFLFITILMTSTIALASVLYSLVAIVRFLFLWNDTITQYFNNKLRKISTFMLNCID